MASSNKRGKSANRLQSTGKKSGVSKANMRKSVASKDIKKKDQQPNMKKGKKNWYDLWNSLRVAYNLSDSYHVVLKTAHFPIKLTYKYNDKNIMT